MEDDDAAYNIPSTPGAFRLQWDVFLSFRGEDTRHTFTSNLYSSLHNHGVRVFRDDDGLRRGDEIASSFEVEESHGNCWWKSWLGFHQQATQCIEGIVLDFEKRLEKPLKDPSGDTISWYNLQRNLNFTSAVTYLKERYKRYLEDRAEKEREVVIVTNSLKTMVNLRLLQINNVNLEGKFKYLPVELKWLQWKGCPMKSLPSDFHPRKVAVLDLSESKIEQLWGSHNNKMLENLMVLNLHGCFNLAAVPDLSGHQTLEKFLMILRCCHHWSF
ncbi:hypothetical protein CMV_003337 [Castanea mollissima]|uniref:TIR domain-containing protein n=1 Tax=Castanea mollissima TaxID=60419 RepID=A0A8J4VVA2_9ROSI|nr:hypothetical protein CMV_003337 [Castanea mollissima]